MFNSLTIINSIPTYRRGSCHTVRHHHNCHSNNIHHGVSDTVVLYYSIVSLFEQRFAGSFTSRDSVSMSHVLRAGIAHKHYL